MTNICMCEEHTAMIRESSMDDLINMSNYQSSFMHQLDEIIKGMDDPFWDIAQIFIQHKGRPMSQIVESMKAARENASKIFDIVQEEIKLRLDQPPSHRDSRHE